MLINFPLPDSDEPTHTEPVTWHPSHGPRRTEFVTANVPGVQVLGASRAIPHPRWITEVACAERTDAFVAQSRPGIVDHSQALEICATCPVADACLQDVLDSVERDGGGSGHDIYVRGGLTPPQLWDRIAAEPVAEHGVPANYKHGRCRCTPCTDAYRERQASYDR